jgi:FtsH-binding integral membrane protein
MSNSSPGAPRRYPGRLFLLLGLGLAVLGVAAYVVQVRFGYLKAPWYMPIAATLGVALLVASLWQARTVWRVLALLLLMLVAGAEWAFLLGTRLPAYTGPVAAGEPFPAFTTARANGAPFTQRDLEGDKNSVLVFFRGRW